MLSYLQHTTVDKEPKEPKKKSPKLINSVQALKILDTMRLFV